MVYASNENERNNGLTLKNITQKTENFKVSNFEKKIISAYTVRNGDTLSSIALKCIKNIGVKITGKNIMTIAYEIANHNAIMNPDFIITGQKIDLSIVQTFDFYATQNKSINIKEKTTVIQSKHTDEPYYSNDRITKISEISPSKNKYKKPPKTNIPTDEYDELTENKVVSNISPNRKTKKSHSFMKSDSWDLNSNTSSYFKLENTLSYKDKILNLNDNSEKNNKPNSIYNKKGDTVALHNIENTLNKNDNTLTYNDINKNNKGVDVGNIKFASPTFRKDKLNSIDNKPVFKTKNSDIFKKTKQIKINPNETNTNQTAGLSKSFSSTSSKSNVDFYTESKFITPVTVNTSETNKELQVLVKRLIQKAEKPEQLPKFKNFQKIISIPFGSTPLFLQTLESLKIAEQKKNLAYSKFLPQVSSSIGGGFKTGGLNNDSSSQSRNLSISQLVYDFGVTRRQYEVTEKEELSSQSKIDQQRTELLLEIITSFLEVYRAQTLLKLSQGFVDSRSEFLESVKTREKLGGSSNADVIRAETKLSEALDKVPTEVQGLKNSLAEFEEYFDIKDPLKTELHQVPKVEDVTFELNNTNIDKNFRINEISNQISAAELNFEAEKRSRYGKFGIQAGYQNTDTNLNTPQEQSSILLTYQIDLFTGFESQAKISQASLKVNALRFELERMRKELIKELNQSKNSYEAQSALVLSRVALVKGAELSNQVNRELFELNKSSINDLFRSQEEFLTASKNLVDATVEKNLSFYRLAAKFGTLLNLFELRT